MLNTTYLRSIRHANPISPQGDVLQLSPYEQTPVPTFKPGWRNGVDFMHGTSFWSVCLPPCRVNKFSCVSGDGRPGYDKENPKKNVYELHLTPVNASFRPLKAVLGMAQEWCFNAPGVFSASSEAVDGDFDLWKERCNLPHLHSGLTIKQGVWAGGAKKYVPIFENGVEVTGTTDLCEGDIVRVEATFYGYEMNVDTYGFGIRFGPRGVHIMERQQQCGSGSGSASPGAQSSSATACLTNGSEPASKDAS